MTQSDTTQFEDRQTECWAYPKICVYENALTERNEYFSFLDEEPESSLPLRIYVHVPYCKQFCTFCPYHKSVYGATERDVQNRMFHAFARELEMYAARPQVAGRKVSTIYFGGGDPSVISIEQQDIIWSALRKNFDIDANVDVTMEGTALSFLDAEKLAFMKEQGVTRVSFGIQTFEERLRPQLNLEPTVTQLFEAIGNIQRSGIASFSFDMMYNLPGQTDDMFYRDLEIVRGIDAQSVDFYALNLYPNTTYLKQVNQEKFGKKPSNAREVWMYREIMRLTREWSYNQTSSVSVSRTARDSHLGFDQFLRGYPMIGIGPSSRSFVAGRNYRNHSSDERYLKDIDAGLLPVEAGAPFSSTHEENRPFVFFPIRLKLEWPIVERSPRNQAIVEGLIRDGYARKSEGFLELSEEGRVWAGNIQRLFFSPEERKRERNSFFTSLIKGINPYNQDQMGVSRAARRVPSANAGGE